MRPPQLDVTLKSSVFDPDEGDQKAVPYQEAQGGTRLYRVYVYLDGPGLPFVESVTYRLHPTFPKPEVRVVRTPANPRCKVEIWTWGTFQSDALVQDKRGGQVEISAWLGWDRELPGEQRQVRVGGV